MSHAITIGDLVFVAVVGLGIVSIVSFIFFLLWVMNPFRSGH